MSQTDMNVPCRYCGKPTMMLGTRLCDRCWEIWSRCLFKPDRDIVRKILEDIEREQGY